MFGIIITPPRSAQPNPLTSGRKRPHKGERERPPPAAAFSGSGKISDQLSPLLSTTPTTAQFLSEHRAFNAKEVYLPVQTEWHFPKTSSLSPPPTRARAHTHTHTHEGER